MSQFERPANLPVWAHTVIRRASGLYEGVCECGVGHPVGKFPAERGVHGCCGCCWVTEEKEAADG